MGDRVEVKVDRSATAGLDVHFQQGDRRSDAVVLEGPADEIKIGDSPFTETVSAWARVVIHKTTGTEGGESKWEVVCSTNVVNDGVLESALARIKKRIEQIIRDGISGSFDVTDGLRSPGWESGIEWRQGDTDWTRR